MPSRPVAEPTYSTGFPTPRAPRALQLSLARQSEAESVDEMLPLYAASNIVLAGDRRDAYAVAIPDRVPPTTPPRRTRVLG